MSIAVASFSHVLLVVYSEFTLKKSDGAMSIVLALPLANLI